MIFLTIRGMGQPVTKECETMEPSNGFINKTGSTRVIP